MRLTVRKKLTFGFGIILLLLVIVAGGNMNMQTKISGMTTANVQIMGNKALMENIKYSIANTNATGTSYLQSKTQQEADMYLKKTNQAELRHQI